MLYKVIKKAIKDNIKWLIHIDSDEIIHCEGSILKIIESQVTDTIQTIQMTNYEAKYPFINSDKCFYYSQLINCQNFNSKCIGYNKGKGGGRVSEYLAELGSHQFRYLLKTEKITNMKLKDIYVLHFETCNFNEFVIKLKNLSKENKFDFSYEFITKGVDIIRSYCSGNEIGNICREMLSKLYTKYKIEASNDYYELDSITLQFEEKNSNIE